MPKRVVRQGVFETNSSSVHSLTICTPEEYDRWEKGEMIFDNRTEKLIELKDIDSSSKYRYETVEEYNSGCSDYETFEHRHTTKSGDQIVVFGYHGENH